MILLLVFLALVLGCSAPEAGPKDVLAEGYALPSGFTSVQATGRPGGNGQRIEAIFQDTHSGVTVRYSMARGSMRDVAPGEPVLPIDTCIRDAGTGELLFAPSIFGDRPLIEGCGGEDDEADTDDGSGNAEEQAKADNGSEQLQRKRAAALAGLVALRTVRFKPAYEPEREELVGHSIPPTIDPTILQGGRVVSEDESGTVVFFDQPKAP